VFPAVLPGIVSGAFSGAPQDVSISPIAIVSDKRFLFFMIFLLLHSFCSGSGYAGASFEKGLHNGSAGPGSVIKKAEPL
jgi:hypothetical protein